jgi:hypothetical protein
VEWEELEELCLACNPHIKDQLITSRRTAVRRIEDYYSKYLQIIKNSLQSACSPIHIASDLWTSPHRHAMLAICAQWVDSSYQLRKALLALPECPTSHSGEAQGDRIVNVLSSYGILTQLGWHTGDNALSNDTCLQRVAQRLDSDYNVKFDASKRRVRCIAHIINLSLQAFLLATSKEALHAALNAIKTVPGEDIISEFSSKLISERMASPTSREQAEPLAKRARKRARSRSTVASEEYQGMERTPTLIKLHGLAVWLRTSAIHANLWDTEVKLRIGIDNVTRWSSWFHVIDRTLSKKEKIITFMLDHEAALDGIRFTAEDWSFLGHAHTFLQPFTAATLIAEGRSSSISQSLELMDLLLNHYEQQKVRFSLSLLIY